MTAPRRSEKTCEACSGTFLAARKDARFCSGKCQSRKYQGDKAPARSAERTCVWCRAIFKSTATKKTSSVGKYCSSTCNNKAWRRKRAESKLGRPRDKTLALATRRDAWGMPRVQAPRVPIEKVQAMYEAHFVKKMSHRDAWNAAGGYKLCHFEQAVLWLSNPDIYHPFIDDVIDLRLQLGDASVFHSMTVWERNAFVAKYKASMKNVQGRHVGLQKASGPYAALVTVNPGLVRDLAQMHHAA